ncbi:MAG: NAD(P)H-hydrate dehydratase [Bacteroidales bacterium]|nr:NAD(P)H-hydrate dehydratase [Candidatus Sodaliphilus limicaballi]
MKIFTNDAIRRIFEKSIEVENITMLDMMERAASAVTYEIVKRWRSTKRIVVFAGPGDNGGDALAVSRMLFEQGYSPEVYLLNVKSSHLSNCCSANRDRLYELEGLSYTEVTETFNLPDLSENDVVIDGLFGSGLRAPLKGGYTSLVQYINDSGAYIVSIDMPSGLHGEKNATVDRRNIIKANLTLVYQFKRLAFFFAENAQFIGECVVLDLELNRNVIAELPSDFYLIDQDDASAMIRDRNQFTNKYDHGSIFLVAGSYGMMGSAILAARGAMRSGAGLVTVHAPRMGYMPLQTAVPEALYEPDSNEYVTSAIEMHHRYSVVAIGPGITSSDETLDALDTYLKSFHHPCLLDADALNCINRRPMLIRSIPKGSVITPHAIEFDRLFGKHNTDEERFLKALNEAKLYDITIVLKGHHTMTIFPSGKVYINSSGNAGMATAGSGDVLTGVIASFIAQGYQPDMGVVLGVFIHGLAGDIAATEHSEYGVMASDIVDNLGTAIKTARAQARRY